ncbi:MAG: linear amide C-N hydrolase [Saccharofermentans sp.]|nr:linear amide C-N hydrolase [Saccharofermentans sp.]
MLKKIILVLAVIMTGVGIFMWVYGDSWIYTLDNDYMLLNPFDPDSFKPGAYGSISLDPGSIWPISSDLSAAWVYKDVDGEECGMVIPLEGSNFNEAYSAVSGLSYEDKDGNTRVMVEVVECPDDQRQEILQGIFDTNEMTYESALSYEDADPSYIGYMEYAVSDEGKQEIEDMTSHYKCIVVSSANFPLIKAIGTVLTVIGAVILTITLLTFKFSPRKIVLGVLALVLMGLSVCLISQRKKISTIASLKEYKDGVYTLRYTADYKLDELLASDVSSEKQLFSWAEDNLYYGLPISSGLDSFGCAALSITTPEGKHLMGRNYDFYETDCVMIYTDPEDGYASIGMVDTQYINVGGDDGDISMTSPLGRMSALAFPYMTVDGMNEAGVGVSILMLDQNEIHQDNGKPDIMMTVAIRAILDTCGSVDEAVALLDSYDMHSMIDSAFHLYITDRSGAHVVVEWLGGEMVLTDPPAVTNFVMGDPEDTDYIQGGECRRYDALMVDWNGCFGIASEEETMSFMADASDDENADPGVLGTEWSCVYNLDDFEVTVCFDLAYNEPYSVTPETFGVKR